MENQLLIGGREAREEFLEELRKKYGGNITIRELQIVFSKEKIPIENCRFTGIDGLSEKDEFTGTIREIIDSYGMSEKELANPEIIEWLVKLFTSGEKWINDIKGEEFDPVKCVAIDRILKEDEVRKYLQELAEEEAKKAEEAAKKAAKKAEE